MNNLEIIMVVCQLNMSGFTHLLVHKFFVYTPIFDSETINVIVYSIFRGSPKLKVEPFILILLDIKMHNTVDEKYI